MYRALELVIAALITLMLFVLIALFLPSSARVERKVELANPLIQIYDMLNHFKKYNAWQPWNLDARAQYNYEGAEFGIGSKFIWKSEFNKTEGQGSLEIIESEPEAKIKMALVNDWKGHNKTSTFILEPSDSGKSTVLRWVVEVDYGWDLFGRYSGLYLDGHVGEFMASGLVKLSQMMSGIPNADYSQVEVTMVDLPPTDLLYVGGNSPAAPRSWDEAEQKMMASWKEVETYMRRANLQASGSKRRIINVMGEETNDFNLAYPVAAYNVEAAPPAGNVRWMKTAQGRALSTQYRGHRVGVSKSRDMLRAYALTHGYEFDRDLVGAWEEWPEQTDEIATPVTVLYLPIATP
jgi:hypothetical protein